MSTAEREWPFSPDFSARVVAQADGVRRRHRARRLGVATTAAVSTAMTASVLFLLPGRHTVPVSQAQLASLPAPRADFPGAPQTDPLQYLFPDAAPVARFADSYSERIYGRGRKAGELLFADDMEDSGDF